jgi:hypothetical protein
VADPSSEVPQTKALVHKFLGSNLSHNQPKNKFEKTPPKNVAKVWLIVI